MSVPTYIFDVATVTTSGSRTMKNLVQGARLTVNILGNPTGITPTIQFKLEEVDPGDEITVVGSTATTGVFTGPGTETIEITTETFPTVKVSWTITGVSPSFSDVYATFFALNPEEQLAVLHNGGETVVSNAAVQVIAANSNRKGLIIQVTGAANVRIGSSGVTATTGMRLVPDQTITFSAPFVVTNAIYAIREGGVDSLVLAQEVV